MHANGAEPVYLISNSRSGTGAGGAALVAQVRAGCEASGRPLVLLDAERPDQLESLLRRACRSARRDGGRLLVAGGDGTVRLAAQYLAGSATPLGILPTGTFNYFARNLGIPLALDRALALALHGQAKGVALGAVNGKVFLNNASFGLYSRLIRAREQHTRRFGRRRLVAVLSTLVTLFKGHNALPLELETVDRHAELSSPMVFVGINTLQLRGVDQAFARCPQQQMMAVVVMRPVGRWDLFRLTLKGLMRSLEQEQSLERFCASRLTIRPRRRRISVVLDGERMRLRTPLRFRLRTDLLHVIVPEVD